MKILGIIPSRYASTRFPAKSLVDIAGKSMVQRVVEQVLKSTLITDVVVATDDQRIFDHVKEFGGNVCMTASDHQSGTDRCQEALQGQRDVYDYVINIQGDEPFIQPSQIDQLAQLLDGKTQLATLIKPIDQKDQINDSNVVKVVKNLIDEAVYFSRSPIPYQPNAVQSEWLSNHTYYKHIGIYAYRADILGQITQLPISMLEKAESLEQLRWIENGYCIKTAITQHESIGIDTPEDLKKALEHIK
jgi:3-deoxy-manno-octulosonate cytidylyltransferase (CMP-KDO synthetase)